MLWLDLAQRSVMEMSQGESSEATHEYIIAPRSSPTSEGDHHHLLERVMQHLATHGGVEAVRPVGNPVKYLLVKTDARTCAAIQATFAESIIVGKNASLRPIHLSKLKIFNHERF